jgi:hypothetical protein
LRDLVGFSEVLLELDSIIKVLLGESPAELVESFLQACLLFGQFLLFDFFLLLCEGLLLFIVVGNAINVFGLDIGAIKGAAVILISVLIKLDELVLMLSQ